MIEEGVPSGQASCRADVVRQEPAETLLIINTAPDTVALLTLLFEQFGFIVVSCYTHDIRSGRTDLGRLLEQHTPRVIVYDIAPPYERNWSFFEHLRDTLFFEIPIVLTSTNARLTKQIVKPDAEVYEVIETPSELQKILHAVRDAARQSA
jgi:CheY-like chemotaxis protein